MNAQEKMAVDSVAVNSIDGIVNEVLKIISGDEGKVRNWDSFRNLFLPSANFTVLYHTDEILLEYETVTLEEFIGLMHDEY